MFKTSASFYIMTYNQEAFVAAAIEAAFAQDVQGMEIIISDDNSTDRTWDIILETVKKCEQNNPGKHTVILNRNDKNLGICGHINKIVSLCSNDIIVCSAGDDISYPDRVRKSLAAFKADPGVMLVSGAVDFIDEKGQPLPGHYNKRYGIEPNIANVVSGAFIPVGCAIACRKELYCFFGRSLPEECHYEDIILALRACLTGKIAQIKEPLVHYRESENSLTNFKKNSPSLIQKKKSMALHSFLAVKAQMDDFSLYIKQFPEKKKECRKNIRCLARRLAQKEQSLWIWQYSLPKVLALKIAAVFKGKNLFSYLHEVIKHQKTIFR